VKLGWGAARIIETPGFAAFLCSAAASYDDTARLWDRDGKPLAILGHTETVDSALFSPDGGLILTASRNHTVWLWEAFPKPQNLVDHIKAEVPRCLAPAQRQRLFLAPTPPPITNNH